MLNKKGWYRNKSGKLYLPFPKKNNVIVLLKDPPSLMLKDAFAVPNIITDAGDIFYAQLGSGNPSTNTFTTLYLGDTGVPSVSKGDDFSSINLLAGSEKAIFLAVPSYPKPSDPDLDNTGSGVDVITRKYFYLTGDGPFVGITEGLVANPGAGGTDPILCHFDFGGSFNKDGATIAEIYINHESRGV